MRKDELRKILKLKESLNIIKIEDEDNKLLVSIRSNKKKVRCPYCNEFSSKIHDYLKPTRVDYLSIYEKPVYLIVYKRRFECSKCKKSFTEDLGLTNKNANISLLTKRSILKDCMDRDKTIKQIALDNKVSEKEVRVTFLEAVKNYPDTITNLPEVISFDEVSTYTSEGVYSFILNDPIHRYTLDILKSRKKDFLIEYFLKVNNRKSVKFVICDLYKPYYEVVKTCFPNSIFVADPFHYTRYIEEGLDNVRMKLVHKYEDNKNSKEYRLIKSRTSKGLLLKSFNETKYELKIKQEREEKYKKGHLKDPPKDKYNDYWYGKIRIKKNNHFIEMYRIDRLNEVLDIDEELKEAYNLKEEFLRILYNVKYENAKEELKKWIKKSREANIDEMNNAANTIENWIDEIVNSFLDERYTNGFTEANNNTIDKIVDRAYGYKNFQFFRLRVLVILHQSYSLKKVKNSKKVPSKKWWKFYKNEKKR